MEFYRGIGRFKAVSEEGKVYTVIESESYVVDEPGFYPHKKNSSEKVIRQLLN